MSHDPAPGWYRDAVIYELHVRSFQDSDGDGIGDFTGLTSRLDYLADLGVTAIWLLPFYPSPLRDDGYDIADYGDVNPSYGKRRDFERFLREAHDRGLHVITELVMNHTSDQHEWFQKSRRATPGSEWRDYYVWSDDPDRYQDARIIFQDFEASNWTWDDEAGAYFWHRFYSHQPDLNFENPAVREAMFTVIDFWMDMGVDGVRLDAVPYLFEEEGTNCENLPRTHQFLKELRTHVDERYGNRMLLAEANQWPEDAAAYFGDGDECHMNFHFPVMPRLFMGVKMEDRTPIVDILEQTPALPDGAQWATFLRNHDELTLEMVTDEERDYMYRAYAHDAQMRINLGIRRRLAPLLGNDRRKIELLNGLLFSLPGTPVLYYGDEIGMGDNVYLGDRDSVRTPMQWSPDRNAGFSRANPHSLFLPLITDHGYHHETINVESQTAEPNSLLRWMRRLISLRTQHPVLARGELEFLEPDNPRVLAFLRTDPDGEQPPMLVVANLSRHAQSVELDLEHYLGHEPVEVFGSTPFAPIGELPYYLTLAPFGFFWFTLQPRHAPEVAPSAGPTPEPPTVDVDWPATLLVRRLPTAFSTAVDAFLDTRRWFAGKGRPRTGLRLEQAIPVAEGRRKPNLHLCLFEVSYSDGDPEIYVLPMVAVDGARAHDIETFRPESVVARLEGGRVLVDAMADEDAVRSIVRLLRRREPLETSTATLEISARPALRDALRTDAPIQLLGVDQSNTSVVVGDEAMVKLIRRLTGGTNPDLEIGTHLCDTVGFTHTPDVLGSLELVARGRPAETLAIASSYVAHDSDLWELTLDAVSRFYEDDLVGGSEVPKLPGKRDRDARDRIGSMLDIATLLARRTAELHAALATSTDEALVPEPFSKLFQRSLYQSFRNQIRGVTSLVRRRRRELDPALVDELGDTASLERALLARIEPLRDQAFGGRRIRVHGDLHLGQVLWTGRDVVIIDFEGEPGRPIGERRIKRSPLADVAGVLRSFHYAAHVGRRQEFERGVIAQSHVAGVTAWAEWWRREVSDAFLTEYLAAVSAAAPELLPEDPEERRVLLDAYLVEKACYELRYELDNRPDWAGIPLSAIRAHAEG